jgi:putative DNA-invertase from lambdoid prophage Rac
MRVGIYVRVSTADQNNELQRRELREYAERHGWGIVQVYEDTVSGSAASRAGLDGLMADARARKIDTVLCWKLDRFGRSLRDCLNNLWELDSHGVRFIATT